MNQRGHAPVIVVIVVALVVLFLFGATFGGNQRGASGEEGAAGFVETLSSEFNAAINSLKPRPRQGSRQTREPSTAAGRPKFADEDSSERMSELDQRLGRSLEPKHKNSSSRSSKRDSFFE